MGSENLTGFKNFTATGTAIAKNIRVKVDSSGEISAAGATDDWIGTTVHDVAADGTVTVRLRNQPGTHFFTASAAIAAGARLYATDDGKVDDATAGGAAIDFVAIEVATNNGDIIECAPLGASASGSPFVISLPIALAGVTAADVLTTLTPGFAGTITKLEFAVTTAVTTGAKAATLNAEIGTTNLTGGAVALTSANCTPLGAVISGSAITGNNTFGASDTISIEASSVTAFSEGAGVLFIIGRSL